MDSGRQHGADRCGCLSMGKWGNQSIFTAIGRPFIVPHCAAWGIHRLVDFQERSFRLSKTQPKGSGVQEIPRYLGDDDLARRYSNMANC